jgi:hypothetical protein
MSARRWQCSLPPLCLFAVVLYPGASSGGEAAPPQKADVVVYGGTPAGIIAAITVAREGKSVILIEASSHLGGMVTGGLGATDTGNRRAIGGYSREFFDRVRDHYLKKYGPASPQVKDCSDGFLFEPHVALHVFRAMLEGAKVKVFLGRPLRDVRKVGPRITALTTIGKEPTTFQAAVWIDASYEGDLLARAGLSYTVGREARSKYNESLAGVQKYSPAHQWPVKIAGRNAAGTLLPFIQLGAPGEPGAGDKKIQAYNFRLCLTQRPELRLPFSKPDNYDPRKYELLARYLAKQPEVKVGQLMNPVHLPNGKTDTNNNGPFSTDYIGGSWDYPEADQARRRQLWQEHADYTKGFLWFLANDPRVPKKLQLEMRAWGLARGEFENNGNWPPQLYVREARRLLGAYVMTEADIRQNRIKEESIGLGSYNTDSHHVQRVVDATGFVLNEGDFQVGVQPYCIPYRSLLPQKGECSNLLVPVCCSASHVAYGTIRMEPVYMILGQASGVAAVLAVDGKSAVQDVVVSRLQDKLRTQKAVLSPLGLERKVRGIAPETLPGVVVDDAQAVKKGRWLPSTAIEPFVGTGYLHDNHAGQGEASIRFVPYLPREGRYEVRLFYPGHANRATNALVIVHAAGGEKALRINQKQRPMGGAVILGVFHFKAGQNGWVEIRDDGADGFVVADAVQFLPK